jgi:hypothetical protein
LTISVPCIDGWIVQWYWYVPGFVGALKVTVWPAGAGVSNELPSSEVTVWLAESLLVTETVDPAVTVSGVVNAKLAIVIAEPLWAGAEDAGAPPEALELLEPPVVP